MKRLLLLVVAMLLATISFAQVKKSPAPERAGWDLKVGLYGDVRAVIVTEYEFEEYFGEYKPTETSKYLYLFDDKGNVKTNKSMSAFYGKCTREYGYNKAGNKISMTYLDGLGKKSKLEYKLIYKYDSFGNVVEKTKYNAKGKAEGRDFYKYDAANNVVEELIYDSNDQLDSHLHFTYKYDLESRVVEKIRERRVSFDKTTHTYQYDSAGNLVVEAEYDILGLLWWRNVYVYDSEGNIVQKQCYDDNNALVEKRIYKYDAEGNNIEEVVHNCNGEVVGNVVAMYDANGNVLERTEYKSMYNGNAIVPTSSMKFNIVYTGEEGDLTFADFDVDNEEEQIDDEQVFVKVERMPSFAGGDLNTFRQWFGSEFKYPAIAAENGIQGRLIVKFVVEKDGRLTNIEFLQSPDPVFNEEVLRVLRKSPKWTPGYQQGKPCRVSYVLPIDIRLQ